MTTLQFHAQYDGRVHKYAVRFAKLWDLPADMARDLHNVCYTVIPLTLRHWRVDGGKSPFNWCAPKMKRAMMDEVKRYYGNKPNWRGSVIKFIESIEDREFTDGIEFDIDLCLDLKKRLHADSNPTQIRRFIAHALDPHSGADIAAQEQVTRQAVNYAVQCARRRLQKACHELRLEKKRGAL